MKTRIPVYAVLMLLLTVPPAGGVPLEPMPAKPAVMSGQEAAMGELGKKLFFR